MAGFPWPQQSAVAFICVQGVEEVTESRSVRNEQEANAVGLLVSAFVAGRQVGQSEIGVITPYAAQTTLIKRKLGSADMSGVEVANVDRFQGRENEVIILSLVRSNFRGHLGHVDDGQRLNVALTRARRGLVVVGNAYTLCTGFESGLRSFLKLSLIHI